MKTTNLQVIGLKPHGAFAFYNSFNLKNTFSGKILYTSKNGGGGGVIFSSNRGYVNWHWFLKVASDVNSLYSIPKSKRIIRLRYNSMFLVIGWMDSSLNSFFVKIQQWNSLVHRWYDVIYKYKDSWRRSY